METTKATGKKSLKRRIQQWIMNCILYVKKANAKWRHGMTGNTYYVVATSWHDVRVLDKQTYDYCKKWLKKKRGKDLSRAVMYRADGTLMRNPNHIDNL